MAKFVKKHKYIDILWIKVHKSINIWFGENLRIYIL